MCDNTETYHDRASRGWRLLCAVWGGGALQGEAIGQWRRSSPGSVMVAAALGMARVEQGVPADR